MVDSELKANIICKLASVVAQAEGEDGLVDVEQVRCSQWLFDYVEANVMTYGHLWSNMERSVARLMNGARKQPGVAKAKLLLAEALCQQRQLKNTDGILDLLDGALTNACYEDEQLMARIFCMRAWQLASLGQYRQALRNINLAKNFSKSINRHLHKAIRLSVRCADRVLYRSDPVPDHPNQVKQLVQKLLGEAWREEEKEEEEEEEKGQDGDSANNSGGSFLQMDHRCRLEWSERQGRHFVAGEPIPAGQAILTERAYSVVLEPKVTGDRCGHCYRSVRRVFLPCPGCNQVVYCGPRCQRAGQWSDGHRYECKLSLHLAEQSQSNLHMLRLLNRIGIGRILELHAQHEAERDGDRGDLRYTVEHYAGAGAGQQQQQEEDGTNDEAERRSYLAWLDLIHHSEHFGTDTIPQHFAAALDCALLATHLQGYRCEEISRHDLVRLVEVCLQGRHRVLLNSFRWTKWDSHSKQQLLGSCVCILGSFFNSSCDFNAEWQFERDLICLTTKRAIEPGEPITICYGSGPQDPLSKRLKQNRAYYFQCNCQLCFEDARTVLALACQRCPGPVLVCNGAYDAGQVRAEDQSCMLCRAKLPGTKAKYSRQEQIREQIGLISKLFDAGIDRAKYLAIVLKLAQKISRLLYRGSLILATELDKCCRLMYQESLINECVPYGQLIDQALPMMEELELSCHRYQKMSGPTRAVVDQLQQYLDMTIFWADLFRQHLSSGGEQEPEKSPPQLKIVMVRFHVRMFRLLDYSIERQLQKMELYEESSHSSLSSEIQLLQALRRYKQDQLDNIQATIYLPSLPAQPPQY